LPSVILLLFHIHRNKMTEPSADKGESFLNSLWYRLKHSIYAPKAAPNQLSVGLIGGDIPVYPPLMFLLVNTGGLLGWYWTGDRKSFVVPKSLASLPSLRAGLGLSLSYCCVQVVGACRKELRKAGTASAFQPVVKVCDTGPYAYGRNFMYTALLGVNLAGSVAFDSAWLLYSMVGLGAYLNFVVIPAEERLLRKELDPDYGEYCKRVPRWFWIF
jgi:protein-S-isoprenylcysteine O-methyltransferase Ste14